MYYFAVVDTDGNVLQGVSITVTNIYSPYQTTTGVTDSNGKLTLQLGLLIPEVDAYAEPPSGYACIRCTHLTEHEGSFTFVLEPLGEEASPIHPACAGLGFTEVVTCEQISDWFYAAGWTQSKGIGAAAYPYIVPIGWEADPNKSNISGLRGSHGGCSQCAMTLVHIRRYVGDEVPPGPPIHPACAGLGFTEVVTCEQISDWFYAAGWTQSKGIGAAAYPYIVPIGWEADPNKSNISGLRGSHGGCSQCAMTLVHIRRYVGDEVPPGPPTPPPGSHCYNTAGELVMTHGEEKCVSGDKYVCLDGVLTPHPRHPDCNEVEEPKKEAACPIACVCMGTPLIDALGPIREFRDFILKKNRLGRCFVSSYYTQVGPFLSLILARNETLRKAGRWVVRRILRGLEK